MVPIFYDLDYENMFLNVLKDGSRIASHYVIYQTRINRTRNICSNLLHILTTNTIKYVPYDTINC
jgi:hypothetical protein